MSGRLILGDVCDDCIVCEHCEQPLDFGAVYISTRRDDEAGCGWCIPCVQGTLDRAKEMAAT